MPVPVSLAPIDGSLRSGTKSILADILSERVNVLTSTELEGLSCIVIDGQALVMALGKPVGATTFGDFADHYIAITLHLGDAFERIDVCFDRYNETSINDGTRQKRNKGWQSVRRIIESRSVPLPCQWHSFLSDGENKENLAAFLSDQLLLKRPDRKVIVVSGGLSEAKSTDKAMNLQLLQSETEEADTRMIYIVFMLKLRMLQCFRGILMFLSSLLLTITRSHVHASG